MNNLSDIFLSEDVVILRKKINQLKTQINLVDDKDSLNCRHRKHLILTYKKMISIANEAIDESQSLSALKK